MALAITLSNGRTWRTKAAALSHFKAMLARHTDGAVVEDPAQVFAPGFEGMLAVGKRNFARVRLIAG